MYRARITSAGVLRAALLLAVAYSSACAGHADHTRAARSALDAGRPSEALKLYNETLDVDDEREVPSEIGGDNVLFVLDRSTILQALEKYSLSSRDLELADKQIEMLDFSTSTLDDIGKYVFSDDTGPYRAPPYEKLLINTLNMLNHLARNELNGARVEARRFAVMQQHLTTDSGPRDVTLGPGSYLAGFIFEKSNQPAEALRFYDEALQSGHFESLRNPVLRLQKLDNYDTPRFRELLKGAANTQPDDNSGEVLVAVNYGRVPAKYAERIPIGLALTYASTFMSPADSSKAAYLAGQGLVTWINYPALGKASGAYGLPEYWVDGQQLPLEGMVAVDVEARRAYDEIKGRVIASAITRMITRIVAGEATRRVVGGIAGALLSLGAQATLTATDTPDTRSWSTLPARIAFGRVRLPPGLHTIVTSVSGVRKTQVVELKPHGFAVVNLTVLN